VPKVRACDHDQLIVQPQKCIDCAQSANVPLKGKWKVLEGQRGSCGTEFRYVYFRGISIKVHTNCLLSKNSLGRQLFGDLQCENFGVHKWI
jgi:hypothetical protein